MLTQLLGGDFANLKMIYFERNEQSFNIFDDSAVMRVCVYVWWLASANMSQVLSSN